MYHVVSLTDSNGALYCRKYASTPEHVVYLEDAVANLMDLNRDVVLTRVEAVTLPGDPDDTDFDVLLHPEGR